MDEQRWMGPGREVSQREVVADWLFEVKRGGPFGLTARRQAWEEGRPVEEGITLKAGDVAGGVSWALRRAAGVSKDLADEAPALNALVERHAAVLAEELPEEWALRGTDLWRRLDMLTGTTPPPYTGSAVMTPGELYAIERHFVRRDDAFAVCGRGKGTCWEPTTHILRFAEVRLSESEGVERQKGSEWVPRCDQHWRDRAMRLEGVEKKVLVEDIVRGAGREKVVLVFDHGDRGAVTVPGQQLDLPEVASPVSPWPAAPDAVLEAAAAASAATGLHHPVDPVVGAEPGWRQAVRWRGEEGGGSRRGRFAHLH